MLRNFKKFSLLQVFFLPQEMEEAYQYRLAVQWNSSLQPLKLYIFAILNLPNAIYDQTNHLTVSNLDSSIKKYIFFIFETIESVAILLLISSFFF